jgi:pimeloyl-ACP methyl ester carboxylesterase
MAYNQDYLNEFVPQGINQCTINNNNGLDVHVLDTGYKTDRLGVLLLLHGFPELSFSWRRTISPLISAGYRVIAPDQRGYGLTSGADDRFHCDLSQFRVSNLVIDLLGLLAELKIESVKSIIGHDFGSYVAAYSALFRPDKFNSVILMSAPFGGPPNLPYHKRMSSSHDTVYHDLERLNPPRKHYQAYFSTENANHDMAFCSQGIHDFLRAYFHFKSGDWPANKPFPLSDWSAKELAQLPLYYIMNRDENMSETVARVMPAREEIKVCKWLTDKELNIYSSIFKTTGFQGGLNWYRCRFVGSYIRELALFSGRKIQVPSCFIAGTRDWGIYQVPGSYEAMKEKSCSDFRGYHLIEGAGHWVQQEKPELVTEKFLNFLHSV